MKLVLTLVARDEVDVLDAHLAYHLNAGVDFVLAADRESGDGTTEILESYARDGYLLRLAERGNEAEARSRLARLAATEHGADWVIDSDADEFWWPRGEDLKDVLAAVPERYAIVQALVRLFLPRADGEVLFAERLTIRRSLDALDESAREPLEWALRPVYRAEPQLDVGFLGGGVGGRRVPLRAWYPIEVLRFPVRSLEQSERRFRDDGREARSTLETELAEAARAGDLERRYRELAAAEGALVVDPRLAEALRKLRTESGFALPDAGARRLTFRAPDIVDDAAYAVECAAVGEVDIAGLEQRIEELAARIDWLEQRFWPRVLRGLARLVRR